MIIRHPHGFTLVEMIVATVIFMLFIASVYGTYTATQQSMARAEETAEVYQTGRIILAQLNAQITSAYQPAGDNINGLIGEDAEEVSAGARQDRLTLLTTARQPYGDEPAGDICEVSYTVGDGTADEPTGLYVTENRYPGLEAATDEPEPRLLSPLVIGMNCLYLPAEDDWVEEWIDETTLPRAVRVELTLRPEREDAKPVVLVTTANPMMATAPMAGGADVP